MSPEDHRVVRLFGEVGKRSARVAARSLEARITEPRCRACDAPMRVHRTQVLMVVPIRCGRPAARRDRQPRCCRGRVSLKAVEDRERGVDPRIVAGCVGVEHEAPDDGEGESGLGLGGDVVGAGRSQELGELREPVVDAGAAETREPVGLGLGEGVHLVEEPKEGTVGGVGDDCAQRADEAAEIPGALLGKLVAAGVEQLAASMSEGGGDEPVAGSEVVGEHSGAGLQGVRELSEGDLTALAGDEQLGRLGLQTLPLPLVTRSTRYCNVITGIGG
jgi:hypothetical protein